MSAQSELVPPPALELDPLQGLGLGQASALPPTRTSSTDEEKKKKKKADSIRRWRITSYALNLCIVIFSIVTSADPIEGKCLNPELGILNGIIVASACVIAGLTISGIVCDCREIEPWASRLNGSAAIVSLVVGALTVATEAETRRIERDDLIWKSTVPYAACDVEEIVLTTSLQQNFILFPTADDRTPTFNITANVGFFLEVDFQGCSKYIQHSRVHYTIVDPQPGNPPSFVATAQLPMIAIRKFALDFSVPLIPNNTYWLIVDTDCQRAFNAWLHVLDG